jgi:PilZ domain
MPAILATGKERVRLRLRIEARGTDADGREFHERGSTVEIHREGALIELPASAGRIVPGQALVVRRQHDADVWLEAKGRVLAPAGARDDLRFYSMELLPGEEEFWGIEFPERAQSRGTVACMLLECCFCRRRQVVYMTERDMLCFNIQKGVARKCESCEIPTIWIQTLDEESEGGSAGSGAYQRVGHPTQPHHKQVAPRISTRLAACVRAAGTELEMAVCENMSRGGLCFRTRRRFQAAEILEIAVPYTKGAANIFVPARVIYAQEVPSAGLHRHGAAYLRAPEEEDPETSRE